MVQKLSLVAHLRVPAEDPANETENYETAARAFKIRLRQFALHRPEDLTSALASIAKDRPQALLGAPSGLLYVLRQDVVEFAAKHRLPAVYRLREVVDAGGLMSLSPRLVDFAIRGASYVDKILKGRLPRELPV